MSRCVSSLFEMCEQNTKNVNDAEDVEKNDSAYCSMVLASNIKAADADIVKRKKISNA